VQSSRSTKSLTGTAGIQLSKRHNSGLAVVGMLL
jgi:hypothetical protein